MTDFPRYAIYYTPPAAAPLARFGAGLLGYDAFTGHDVPFPAAVAGAFSDWRELTTDPRKYGFHATLKAPFALAPGTDEDKLIAAFDRFNATPRAIPVIVPVVRNVGGFIAIVAAEPVAALHALAQDCVETFDPLRAPMTPADRARRRPEKLTPRQAEQLDRFGYPFVRDDFLFHMTLSSRLPAERSADVLTVLQAQFAALDLDTLRIDRIALFRQHDAQSRFLVLREANLV
jgi:putative phosphonate metabolism protein